MASKRQVINLPGLSGKHSSPMAVKIGSMLLSSTITGTETGRGELAEGAERQFDVAFQNMMALVERAGMTTDNIAIVTVFVPDGSYRKFINKPWLEAFPDDHNRPARKTTAYALPEGQFVQLQMLAVAGGRRELLEIPGLAHRDPLPIGVKIGDMVYSSVIGGQDPETGKQIEGAERQIEQAFENMRTLVEQAGGTVANIAHVWVFLRERSDQPTMVKTWLKMFPQDGDRPARKTIMYDELKGRETLIQLQFTAVLNGRRENFEIPVVGHHDPIPMGAKVGNLLFSSGIGGYDSKSGKRGQGLERQVDFAFENMRALVERAGGQLGDIGHVTTLIRDYGAMAVIAKKWREVFPQENDQPACHAMALGLSAGNLVQLHILSLLTSP
ncbi:MAG: RidA family protein [Deltaproteobacteria bacterium]|nr:RidA family protein [Deltaproteobacteria bacterium]